MIKVQIKLSSLIQVSSDAKSGMHQSSSSAHCLVRVCRAVAHFSSFDQTLSPVAMGHLGYQYWLVHTSSLHNCIVESDLPFL